MTLLLIQYSICKFDNCLYIGNDLPVTIPGIGKGLPVSGEEITGLHSVEY